MQAKDVRVRASGLTSAAFSMAPASGVDGHAHEGWHLLRIHEGMFEEDGLGQICRGSVRLSPPGTAHRIRVGDAVTHCENIHIKNDALVTRLDKLALGGQLVLSVPKKLDALPSKGVVADNLNLHEDVAALINAANDGDYRGPPEWLREARLLLLNGNSAIATISARFGKSEEHFARSYSRHYGTAPITARGYMRLQLGLDLVIGTDLTLSEAALEAGYSDQSHMTRHFSRAFGATPGRLRRLS